MDREGSYTHSTTQDYPSVSQINQKVKENSVNLIFAVTKEQFHIYDQLGKHVEGAGCGVLSNDSSNIVELVQEQYNVSIPFFFISSYLFLNCSNSYFSKTEAIRIFTVIIVCLYLFYESVCFYYYYRKLHLLSR